MIINEDGWILTCKHIAQNIILADKIMEKYQEVKKDLIANEVPPKKIYKKYGISEETAVIFRNVFLNVVDTWTGMRVFMHEYLELRNPACGQDFSYAAIWTLLDKMPIRIVPPYGRTFRIMILIIFVAAGSALCLVSIFPAGMLHCRYHVSELMKRVT